MKLSSVHLNVVCFEGSGNYIWYTAAFSAISVRMHLYTYMKTSKHVNNCNNLMTTVVIKLCHLGLVGGEVTVGWPESVPSRWCRASTRLGLFSYSSTFNTGRLFTRISRRFQNDSVKMVFNLFTKGRLSSLAAHNGISLRKSDEEECVFWGAHNWQGDVLFSEGRRLSHKSTHTTIHLTNHSLLISHAHTHIAALILQMNKVVLSLPVRLCYMCGALETGCVCSGLMCSVWFGWHTVKWT